jgi:hypothetical protein
MSWTNLISAVNAVITSNGANEITGQVLRELLTVNVIPILGSSKYKGLAIPSTSPGTPQYDVFYIASQAGTYANFGGAVIPKAGIYTLRYVTNAWVLDTILAIEDSAIVGDRYATISTNSKALKSSGSISYTVKPFLSYVAEQDIIIAANAGAYMRARVTSYNSTTGALVADVKEAIGAGTYTAWVINLGSLVPYWGDVLGTLSDQTDLQTALNLKANTSDLTALSNTVSNLSDAVSLLQDFRDEFNLTGASNGDTLIYNGTDWLPSAGFGGNNVLYIAQIMRALFAGASYTELNAVYSLIFTKKAFNSLTSFQTILWPETKVSKIGFFQKPDTNSPNYRILEADFSRPGVGATVFRNGTLIDLAANVPDWDDLSGSPVIKMRPQIESIRLNSSNFTGTSGLKTNVTESIVSATIIENSSPLQLRETAVNATHAAQITPDTALIIGEVYTRLVVFNLTANRPQVLISDAGQTNMAVNYNFLTNTEISKGGNVIEYDFYRVGEIIFFRVVWAATGIIARPGFNFLSGGSNTYLGDVNEGITLHHIGYYPGNVKTTPINTGATTLTRAANSFEFSNLITKGSIAANGDFTLLINPYIYENVDYNTAVVRFLSGSTQIFSLVMYPDGRLRVIDRVNGGWITPTQNAGEGLKPIILVFNGATKILKVYFQGALQGTSPDLTLSVDKVEFNAPDDIAYDLRDLVFSPVVLTEKEVLSLLVTDFTDTLAVLSGEVTALQTFRDEFDLSGASNGDTLVYDGNDWVPGEGLPIATAGQVYQKGATLVEALSREDFGAQAELITKSVLALNINVSSILGNHRNSVWYNLGTPISNVGNATETFSVSGIEGKLVKMLIKHGSSSGNKYYLNWGIDSSNYYEWMFNRQETTLTQVVAGTSTLLFSTSTSPSSFGLTGAFETIDIQLPFVNRPMFSKRQYQANIMTTPGDSVHNPNNATFLGFHLYSSSDSNVVIF